MEPETTTYINAIESILGSIVSETKKQAIDDFVVLEKSSNRWAKHARIWLTVWGDEDANKICLKTGISHGSYPNGITSRIGYVVGNGNNQYFDTGERSSEFVDLDNTHVFVSISSYGTPTGYLCGVGATNPLRIRGDGTDQRGWCDAKHQTSQKTGTFSITINEGVFHISNVTSIENIQTYSTLLNVEQECGTLSAGRYDYSTSTYQLSGNIRFLPNYDLIDYSTSTYQLSASIT